MTVFKVDLEDSEPPACGACSGTGMPAFGPPDVGRCYACGGSGVARSDAAEREEDADDAESARG